jgi:hypothetical protein
MPALLFSALQTPAAPAEIKPMQPLGWLFMIASVGFVVILTFWCFYKVLTAPPEDHPVTPPDSLGG